MKGKRLFQLIKELDKKEHRQMINICKGAADKRFKPLLVVLGKRHLSEHTFEQWLLKLELEQIDFNGNEKGKWIRRWIDFACKEIETLLITNSLLESSNRLQILASVFDKRNHEELTAYYVKQSSNNALKEKDFTHLINDYDIELRWLGRNQTRANISRIGSILQKRKEATDLLYHQSMSYFYSVNSALYIDNPNQASYKQILPTRSEFESLRNSAKDEYSQLLYSLAEARFAFYQQQNFENYLADFFEKVEKSDLPIKSKILLQRNGIYVRTIGGIYYGYPLNELLHNTEYMFSIMLQNKFYDTIGYFFLLFFLLLKNDLKRYSLLLKEHKKQFFTEDTSDYELFLDAFFKHLKGDNKSSIAILANTAYSKSNYLAAWSKLLEIKIHQDEGDTKFAEVLMIRTRRFLKINAQQKIIVDPIKNVLAILEDKSSLKTKNSSKRQFAYYDFFLQRF